MQGYPSGQRGWTQDPLAQAYKGSNPFPCTHFIFLLEITKTIIQKISIRSRQTYCILKLLIIWSKMDCWFSKALAGVWTVNMYVVPFFDM